MGDLAVDDLDQEDAHLEGVFLVEIVDGKITHFYAMRNPDKLVGITIQREITR